MCWTIGRVILVGVFVILIAGEPHDLPSETAVKGALIRNVAKHMSKLADRRVIRFADVAEEGEDEGIFSTADNVPYGRWSVCYYGLPKEQAARAHDLLAYALKVMLANLSKLRAEVQPNQDATLPPDEDRPEGVDVPGTTAEERCTFDEAAYTPHYIHIDTAVNAASLIHELKGWQAREAYAEFLSDIMTDLGVPGMKFVDVQGDRTAAAAFPFPVRLFTPTPSFLLTIQIKGRCAVPYTLAKQTALRVALNQLYGPRINLYLTRVKQVIEDAETGSVTVSVVLGAYDDVPHNSIKQATREIQKAAGVDGLTPLKRALRLVGLDFDSAKVIGVQTRSGSPPETPWEWVVNRTGYTGTEQSGEGRVKQAPGLDRRFEYTLAFMLVGGAAFLVMLKVSSMRSQIVAPTASTAATSE